MHRATFEPSKTYQLTTTVTHKLQTSSQFLLMACYDIMSQEYDQHIYDGDYDVACQSRPAPKETCPSSSGKIVKARSTWTDEDVTKTATKYKVVFSMVAVLFIATLALFVLLVSLDSRSNIQDNELKELLAEETRTQERDLINGVAELKSEFRNETRELERNLIGMMEGATSSLNQSGYELMNNVNDNKREIDILRRGARNCSQLRDEHGVTTAGYYLLRSNHYGGNPASYVYCDFKHYADVYTCHHLVHRNGITESGFYHVGSPDDQYWVYCNLDSGSAVTEIWHDSMPEKDATGCENPGCYSHRPQYSISMDKIVAIVNNSTECQQFIKFRCLSAVLIDSISNPYGYWLSREGEKMKYWGGASSRRPLYCACGEAGICEDKSLKCNCHRNSPPMTSDEGYLRDKSKLPVSEIRLGDMGHANEKGYHTLGKLECFGAA